MAMAAFASDRRSGWVRFVVLLLCALFIFATLGAPAAHALAAESVAVFGLAAVLSAATAALGFKLSSSADGQASLANMVQDFKAVAWATGLVLVGSKVNGLVHGMDYIKMQIKNGKTYLDSRVVAWVQQWLSNNGVYNSDSYNVDDYIIGSVVSSFPDGETTMNYLYNSIKSDIHSSVLDNYSKYFLNSYQVALTAAQSLEPSISSNSYFHLYCQNGWFTGYAFYSGLTPVGSVYESGGKLFQRVLYDKRVSINISYSSVDASSVSDGSSKDIRVNYGAELRAPNGTKRDLSLSNALNLVYSKNDTGLSGSDTIGADYMNKTLDQTLAGLKEWAQDWFDAGADSLTNAAAGAVDLPLTVSVGAASANPALNPDVVYNPPFSFPVSDVRSGSTASDEVDAGMANANTAEKTEETTATVSENQSVIDGIVNWALDYISPDTGMFSKFPLCVPYDMYLLACSVLGIDPPLSDTQIFTQNPETAGAAAVSAAVDDDWQPVIHIQNDLKFDDQTIPIDVTVDLTKWNDIMHDVRMMVTIYIIGCLIGSEMWRLFHGGA